MKGTVAYRMNIIAACHMTVYRVICEVRAEEEEKVAHRTWLPC